PSRAGLTVLAALTIARRRFSIASSRPGGVIGVSSGQAACKMETALLVASCSLLNLATCPPVGLTASSIFSLGRLTRPGFGLLQVSAVREPTFAWALVAVSLGPSWLKRSFCSSLSEL